MDKCAVNNGRFWMMDEVEYAGGDTVDFHGVKMNWAGDMTGAEMIAQFQSAYVPSLIQRDTNWIWHAGKPRASAARAGRHGLGAAGIHEGGRSEPDARQSRQGGRQAEEPAARLEVRDQGAHQEPVAGYGPRGGWAAIIRDDLGNTYQGCGYGADTSANYVP